MEKEIVEFIEDFKKYVDQKYYYSVDVTCTKYNPVDDLCIEFQLYGVPKNHTLKRLSAGRTYQMALDEFLKSNE